MRTNVPLLSISVPIYNRSVYLKRMLQNFLIDKELFENRVSLYISDNCSTEDLKKIVDQFKEKGLKLSYHRNTTNIGGDNNIISCYQNATGKYVLVLGSDDVIKPGFVKEILGVLERGGIGLLHLNHHNIEEKGLRFYTNREHFLGDINVWLTFISSNIVRREYIKEVDFDKYRYTNFSQVVLFLLATSKNQKNAILSYNFFEDDNDSASNGGYNLFEVFVVNLLNILHEAVDSKIISIECYNGIKRKNFENFLAGEVARRLILRKKTHVELKGAWPILWNYYGRYPYTYISVIKEIVKTLFRKIGFCY